MRDTPGSETLFWCSGLLVQALESGLSCELSLGGGTFVFWVPFVSSCSCWVLGEGTGAELC